jgi:hypothetical protein
MAHSLSIKVNGRDRRISASVRLRHYPRTPECVRDGSYSA